MKRHINSDKWDEKLNQPDGKIKAQKLETIFVDGEQVKRETVTRTFFKNGEYVDSETIEIIC
jgi:hypothetical protein